MDYESHELYYSEPQVQERKRQTNEALRAIGRNISEESRYNLPMEEFLSLAQAFLNKGFLTIEQNYTILLS